MFPDSVGGKCRCQGESSKLSTVDRRFRQIGDVRQQADSGSDRQERQLAEFTQNFPKPRTMNSKMESTREGLATVSAIDVGADSP